MEGISHSPTDRNIFQRRFCVNGVSVAHESVIVQATESSPVMSANSRTSHSISSPAISPIKYITTWTSPQPRKVVQVTEYIIEGTEIADRPASPKKDHLPPRKKVSTISEPPKTPELSVLGSRAALITKVEERIIGPSKKVIERIISTESPSHREVSRGIDRSRIFSMTHGQIPSIWTLHFD